ncbi:hypothetical protein CLOBY_35130 [Clostridium saccharobutylicum]|uniref:hypothetical protein n=1 Tax=Clostridium saccharobutylicum TaxID=169679 RepID=UPI000983BF16|nr:hypothetical protein [Clostridium saccharobutylicum]AQS11357.1 hypothetical protein CLOBY_35130 [Clostridium saccharobutylicum]MBC2437105.1 hypothetical protein [Clostridium saccharobutylicum]NSB88753.1 hypothetical protein [Clostridium saccharobutylicum]OOM15447.1 hypothetical protein CLSAB_27170 [Clostridium saccharobutylicum]
MYNFDVKRLYSDVIYIIESLDGLVSKSTLNRRKYIHFLDTIKECYEDKNKIKCAKNAEILKQLVNCQKCKCFNCNKECITDGCNRCEPDAGGHVALCDNDIITVYHFKHKSFKLKSNKLKNIETYQVLAIIQDIKYNEYFIVLNSNKKKYIAYYYPEVSGDTFGEIKSIDDFNFAIKAFEDSEVESV